MQSDYMQNSKEKVKEVARSQKIAYQWLQRNKNKQTTMAKQHTNVTSSHIIYKSHMWCNMKKVLVTHVDNNGLYL